MIRAVVERIFAPAVILVSRLWYWQKFTLIIILFTIPVGYALFSFTAQIDRSIAFSEKEISGVHYLFPVGILLQDLQQHRDMGSVYLRGDTSFLPLLEEKEKKIKEDFVLINAKDQEFGKELRTTESLNAIQKKWASLEKDYAQLTLKESVRQHTELISDVFVLIRYIGDISNLILDPDLDTYYLMNTVVNTLPDLSENLSQAREFVLSIDDPKKIDAAAAAAADRRVIINYSKIALIADEKIKRDTQVAFGQTNSLVAVLDNPLKDMSVSVRNFASLLDTFVNTNKVEMPLLEYYTVSTAVIDKNFSLLDSLSWSLHDLLHHRVERFQSDKRIIIEITILSYILILYFFIGFYILVARTVRNLENIAKQLISGKATEVIVLSNDELGEVGESFNTIGKELIASNNEILGRVQELQKKSEELEHLNKFMIDREVKMSELKDEIAKLKSTSPPDLEQGERLDGHGRMKS